MARLIVESGDSRKAYSLKSGKVTVGSGEGCSLSFPESDLAEVHAELECSPDEVVLRLPSAGRDVVMAALDGLTRFLT